MSVFSLTASNDSDPWVDIYEEAENLVKAVKKELHGHVAQSDKFLSHLCTLSGVHETLTANVLADHYNHDQRRWKDWPTGTYTPRFKSFQRIASFCSDSRSPTLLHVHRTLAREDSGPPRLEWPTDAERRVLLCSICENFKSITELIPLAFHARQFLTRWMFLKSIYGVLLSYTHVVFVRFDRSGVILSQAIDLHEEPELLLRSIMGCTSLIEQSLDTSVSTANGQAILSRPSPPGEMTSYIVEESIHQNHVLRGSGTRVLSVFKSDKPETKLVFKDWWRDQNGIDESEVMIAVSGLFGLPHYVSHWAVCEPDGEVQTTDFLDKDLKPAPNFVDEDDIVRYSNQPDSEDVDPDADEVKTASSSLNRESRIHCRMLSRDRGHHLLQFRNTPRVVLTAIHDAILGELFKRLAFVR
ncbi:hypothetical protein SISSUDRAFT_1044909 [Sistotremastrum suecicum HHB10207 ss-3]|uniref:Fungal-type protein kinase domain-containing protein n=1 Tax=Sistotremastrum suecicum HHB10207 ss-3 TaxID=1314776 RepID=A0A166ETW9_9AGAM|nr:hypothetical protein SISSUDRAFT_1044909 [Sistotremastrum suecicum HHB10207 ss-3]